MKVERRDVKPETGSSIASVHGTASEAMRRQTRVGLLLAALIVCGWLALHVWGVFFQPLTGAWFWLAPMQIALQTWLGAGLFIVAHDAMHGSLAPARPGLNRVVGQLCVGVYAAFSYDRLHGSHHRHHAAPGTAHDPDFHDGAPASFGPWLLRFFRTHFGLREFAILTAVLGLYLFVLDARPANLILFWGLPAALSALQLFVFGTWLPHRHREGRGAGEFADAHRARTLDYPWLGSLLACFHFGLHHEHHAAPQVPWWRLPDERRDRSVAA